MKLRNFIKLESKNYGRYANPVGISCPLKSVKLSRTIGKIGIFTVYKAKIGQNASFLSFSGSIS